MIKAIFEKLTTMIMVEYIDFVYNTSKVNLIGHNEILTEDSQEKVIALFWHGDSYCLYPALKGSKLYILITKDRRGDYISNMCDYFGYKTIRIPDTSDGGKHLFKMRKIIDVEDISNVAIALDGPLGFYHVPNDFAFISARLTKRRILPISFSVKRKIKLHKRWDHFKIPLPFNIISIYFNEPIEVTRKDKDEKFSSLKNKIKYAMENQNL